MTTRHSLDASAVVTSFVFNRKTFTRLGIKFLISIFTNANSAKQKCVFMFSKSKLGFISKLFHFFPCKGKTRKTSIFLCLTYYFKLLYLWCFRLFCPTGLYSIHNTQFVYFQIDDLYVCFLIVTFLIKLFVKNKTKNVKMTNFLGETGTLSPKALELTSLYDHR